MKEVVLAVIARDGEDALMHENIGILVINNQSEMLLHKTQSTKPHHYVWEPPHLLQHDPLIEKPCDAAERFLVAVGIDGEVHEAFMSYSMDSMGSLKKIDHLIIALTSVKSTELLKQKTAGECVPFDYVLHDAHEHPDCYAWWFRESLDGVALYLKNLLKQSKLLSPHKQAELS